MSDPGGTREPNQSETTAKEFSAAYPLLSSSWSSGGGGGGGGRRDENEALSRELRLRAGYICAVQDTP